MTSSTSRFDVIDGAKGVGIILVVFGHAWRGAQGAGIIPQRTAIATGGADLFAAVDALIYAFHMPLFFFLSGLLFLETLQKHGTFSLVRGRISRLLWPMALWTWLFFGLKLLAGDDVNAPVSVSEFPVIPLPPFEHLWFLWALFLIQITLVLAYRVGGAQVSQMALRWSAGAAALILAFLIPFVSVPSLIWGPMVAHVPYFLAGITAGGFLRWRPNKVTIAISCISFVGLLWLVQGGSVPQIHSLGLVVFGWIGMLGLLNAGPVLQLLCVLGQGSMAIYLTHTAFSAALRIMMLKIGFDGFVPVVIATTLIGLILPLGVLWWARRLRMTKVLGF